MTAKLSSDEGKTWSSSLLLDGTGNSLSYPDAVVLEDDSILVLYDNGRTTFRKILCARFTEKDILNGSLCESPYTNSFLRNCVSRAPVPADKDAFEAKKAEEKTMLEKLIGTGGIWNVNPGLIRKS